MPTTSAASASTPSPALPTRGRAASTPAMWRGARRQAARAAAARPAGAGTAARGERSSCRSSRGIATASAKADQPGSFGARRRLLREELPTRLLEERDQVVAQVLEAGLGGDEAVDARFEDDLACSPVQGRVQAMKRLTPLRLGIVGGDAAQRAPCQRERTMRARPPRQAD